MAIGLVLNRSRQVPAEESPAFGGIAERFRRAGDLDRAVGLCQEGLGRFPEHLSARVTLGWALLDLGRYEEARAELEQVLKRAPDNLAAIRGLAELHDRTEHDEVAAMQDASPWRPSEPVPADSDESPSNFVSPEVLLANARAALEAQMKEPDAGDAVIEEPILDVAALDGPTHDDVPSLTAEPIEFGTLAPEPGNATAAPAFHELIFDATPVGTAPVLDHDIETASPAGLTLDGASVTLGPWTAEAAATADRVIEPVIDEPLPPPTQPAGGQMPAAAHAASYDSEFLLEANEPLMAEDEGPGPWPPIVLDDPAPMPAAAGAALSVEAPELARPAVSRIPVFGAFGRFLRRDSRRESSLAEHLARS